jgi:adenine-specific DNA-methyltransferase
VSVLDGQSRQGKSFEWRPKRQRSLGIYYTPAALSKAMADWAIRHRENTVLEPSFGGCAFLAAAKARLGSLKAKRPGNQLAGCDIDQQAFAILYSIVGRRRATSRYLKRDFLSIAPGSFPIDEFTCILGNPPFVRHHRIDSAVKKTIFKLSARSSKPLPKTAGLWAHFVSHSLRFLAPNGRMGFVLPGSFLFADYAKSLRESIRSNFERTVIIRLNYKTFVDDGVEERAIVLLTEGFRLPSRCWIELDADSELEATCLIREARNQCEPSQIGADAYRALARHATVIELGDIAKIDIGVVTGDNKFFILDRSKASELGISDSALTPVVPRAALAPGISLLTDEFEPLHRTQTPCLLLSPDNIAERHTGLRRYLATMNRTKRKTGVWLNKRTRWYCPDIGSFPDAVLTYMNHQAPRLILLGEQKITCTNTLHRVWLPHHDTAGRQLVALSLLSSFSQLSAEIVGRWYGGGVLKIEPSEARRLKLVLPEALDVARVEASFIEVNSLMKAGRYDIARQLADQLVLKPILGDRFERVVETLESQLRAKRIARHGRGKDNRV